MKTFRVIRESLSREEVLIQANSPEEAEEIAEEKDHIHWGKEELIHCEVTNAFKVKKKEIKGRIINTVDGYIEADGTKVTL